MTESSRKSMVTASDILRRGGTLLAEPCPKCQGVQIKYRDNVTCINCGDLTVNNPQVLVKHGTFLQSLRELAQDKLLKLSNLLKKESSIENQTSLLELVMRYLDLYEKTSEITETKSAKKPSDE